MRSQGGEPVNFFAEQGMGLFRKSCLLMPVLFFIFMCSAAMASAAQTYVSLTFDDGRASQVDAGAILASHGVHGTFFIISDELGQDPYYMSLADVNGLAQNGNEIGGHTLTHPDLTTLSEAQATQEICGDQQQLQAWGFPAVSFAYPYGNTNASVEAIVKSCSERGYNVKDYTSARIVGGIQCSGCDPAESQPPLDPYAVRTPSIDGPNKNTTLAELETMVTQAETTGGWLVIPFHSVCSAPATAPIPGNASDCPDYYSVSYDLLDQFVQWLTQRSAMGTSVKTVGQVMQLPPPPPPLGPNLVVNPSLELGTADNSQPYGYTFDGYGVNTYSYSRIDAGAHTGTYAEQLTVSSMSSGDRKVLTDMDTSSPAIFGTSGKLYQTGVWYKSGIPVIMVAFYHDSGGWHYWSQSPAAASADSWTLLSWRTPPLPAGADYWSFGPTLTQPGTMTVDDFSAVMINDGNVCTTGKPVLSLSMTASPYWADLSDYQASLLSIDFAISNIGSAPAYNVQVNNAFATNGAAIASQAPMLLGHIQTGNSAAFTQQYLVPPAISSFITYISASAEDGCANRYQY